MEIKEIKEKVFSFFSKENPQKIFRFCLIFVLVISILSLGGITLSRYVSDIDVNVAPNVAFFVTDIGTYEEEIQLGSILPSNNPYIYTINVSNYKDERRINVNLEYDIKFVTTTNLPLTFKVFRNTTNYTGNGIMTTTNLVTDADGTYFLNLSNDSKYPFTFESDQVDSYVLMVSFPESYKSQPEKYQGVIESVSVIVNAKQKI